MTVLLLTKSLSYEQEFVQALNDLGHEALCSKKVLSDLLAQEYLGIDLNYFELLIMSETISDQEVRKIMPILNKYSCIVYRKTIMPLVSEVKEKWSTLGVAGFISKKTCLDDLRETLVSFDRISSNQIMIVNTDEEVRLENLLINFSNQELTVFEILQKTNKKYISRESLSQKLWGELPTKSKESRLSGIIRNIKKKLSDYGFDEACLETSWGRGYRLNPLKFKNIDSRYSRELKVIES